MCGGWAPSAGAWSPVANGACSPSAGAWCPSAGTWSPAAICFMIYTTNTGEALHRIIRKIIKQIYLSLMHNQKFWRQNAYGWKSIQAI